MAFIAYVKQWGEGCDYTIACGTEVIALDAQTHAEALVELTTVIRDSFVDERMLEDAILYEVTNETTIDLNTLYREIKAESKLREAEDELREAEEALRRANAKLQGIKR